MRCDRVQRGSPKRCAESSPVVGSGADGIAVGHSQASNSDPLRQAPRPLPPRSSDPSPPRPRPPLHLPHHSRALRPNVRSPRSLALPQGPALERRRRGRKGGGAVGIERGGFRQGGSVGRAGWRRGRGADDDGGAGAGGFVRWEGGRGFARYRCVCVSCRLDPG